MQNDLTKKDVIKLIETIRVNYTESYSNYTDDETKTLARFWYDSLVDYPRDIVIEATHNAIKNSEYVPKISTILNEINKLLNLNCPSDEQLWAELTSVLNRVYDVSRYLAYPQHYDWANGRLTEIYNSLSEELKLFVVNVSTLVEIAEMTAESLQYERARFFKQMPLLKKNMADKLKADRLLAQTRKKQALPPKSDNPKK